MFRQRKKHISDGILHSNPNLNLKELKKKQCCESSEVMYSSKVCSWGLGLKRADCISQVESE